MGATKNSVKSIEKNRLAGTGFTGEHSETGA